MLFLRVDLHFGDVSLEFTEVDLILEPVPKS
jgi:hypothetical protein